MSIDEQAVLVGLWRRFSPRNLSVERPTLGPDLEVLSKLRLAQRPRVVLFDLYGTLLVSAAGGEPNLRGVRSEEGAAAGRALESELALAGYSQGELGFDQELSESIAAYHRGARLEDPHPEVDIERLIVKILGPLSPAAIRRIALLQEASANPCSPMPGARTLLQTLSSGGIRMGVVSNAQFFTPLLVEALLGAPPEALGLETALSSYSFALGFAKPDLRLFEAVVRVLKDEGISPGEILFVGNSAENDVAPAQELGLLTSLFAGDCRSYRPAGPGKAGSSPDLVVTSLEELPEKILL